MSGAMRGEEAARVTTWAVKAATPRGRADTLASIGAVYGLLEERGLTPHGLTACNEAEVDRDRFSLGTPDGVLCLLTGKMLPAAEARKRFVTRSLPDSYRSDAKHRYVDELVAHVSEAERTFLIAALGWALRGNPSKLWYLLVGDKNGGKTTLFNAVHAAVGNVFTGGYSVQINTAAIMAARWGNPSGHQSGLVGIHPARFAFGEEPPKGERFNEELIKNWTGGGGVQARDVGEKGPVLPAMSTPFIAMNKPNLDSLHLVDDALVERTKLLRYPKLPIPIDGLDRDRVTTVQTDAGMRQAVFAMLMRACVGAVAPPRDTPGVREFLQERIDASIGPVGVFFRERLRVTGNAQDRVNLKALWATLEEDYEPRDGKVEDRDKSETWTLAREVVENLPVAKNSRQGYEWRGVKLVEARICLRCHEPYYPSPADKLWVCGTCFKDYTRVDQDIRAGEHVVGKLTSWVAAHHEHDPLTCEYCIAESAAPLAEQPSA